jgi:hypothetical protein
MVSVEVSMINLEEWKMTDKGYVRTVESTDIMLPSSLRAEVYDWCWEKSILVALEGIMAGMDVWRVNDGKHRMWFKLRWL